MPANAGTLAKQLKKLRIQDHTIIVTGAMEPLRDQYGNLRETADGNERGMVEESSFVPRLYRASEHLDQEG